MSVIDTLRVGGTDYPIDDALALDYNYVSDVTVSSVTYHTYWMVQPTSSNQVYGVAAHPTNGKLYRIYNNKGAYSVRSYDQDNNDVTGDKIKTNAAQTGSGSTVTNSIAAATTLDTVVGTLLNNDYAINEKVENIQSDSLEDVLEAVGWTGNNLFEGTEEPSHSGITSKKQNDGRYLITGTNTTSGAKIFILGTFLCKAGVAYKLNFHNDYSTNACWGGVYPLDATLAYITTKNSDVSIPVFEQDTLVRVGIRIGSGFACPSNFLWSPMISRNGGAYVPYHPTVQEELWNGEVSAPKNVLPNEMVDGTYGGTTYTKNADGTVTTTNNATAFSIRTIYTDLSFLHNKGRFVLSGCPSGGADKYEIGIYLTAPNNSVRVDGDVNAKARDNGSGLEFDVDRLVDSNGNVVSPSDVRIVIVLRSGYGNGYVWKPMICTVEDWNKSHNYSPYYIPLKDVVPTKCDLTNVAPVEDGATASQAYAQGALLVRNGVLYRAKTDIASGAAFTIGTNIEVDSVASEISNVNGNGTVKVAINPTSTEISNFANGALWIET